MGRNTDKAKRSAQRAIRQLKKSRYLETDNTEMVDYNIDIKIQGRRKLFYGVRVCGKGEGRGGGGVVG